MRMPLPPNWNRGFLLKEPLAIMQLVRHGGNHFAHFAAGNQFECVLRGPGAGIGDRILKRKVDLERLGIHTPNPLDDVEFLAVWMTDSVQPRRILESHRIHDQAVAFPLAHGLPIPGNVGILGMGLIQWNLPPNLIPFPELVDVVVGLDYLELQWTLV